MFKGNNNLAVGLFVTLALAAVAVFSMWFAGTKGSEPTERYSILFQRDVSGLSLGGPVYFMGVQVGRVADMGIISDDTIRVRVDIDVAADTPIDTGSFASLTAQGITGVNVINIASEPGEQGPLQRTEGFDHPLIPVRQTGLSALLAQAPDTISKLNAVLDRANELLGDANRASMTNALANVETLTAALAANPDDLAQLPGEMRSLVAESRALVQEVDQTVGDIRPDLTSTLSQLDATSANLAGLTRRVDRWLAENETEIQHFIDNGLGQAPELMFDLRRTLRDLQKLLQLLQEDPSQLIHRPREEVLEVNP
ncbi:MlaD family protein [Elongatibacter sediminis]|uniref:MlaD family protein n=1 Tax=Elongatibacter sediminis TaxID=3119006 RepID=A0AAW9RKA6_9GAMM